MVRMVSCMRSSTRIATLVPRIVRMKKSSNPLVVAWVTMNRPMPSTMQDRLISIDRLLAVRKRNAMRRLGDMLEGNAGAAALLAGLGPGSDFRAHAVARLVVVEFVGHHQFTLLHPGK